MNHVLALYKPQGLTPLEIIEQVRIKQPEYQKVKIGYAGRLDPLAHGVLLLTIGEENKNREKYLQLEKTYQFSVLFGFATDTFDYLGMLKKMEYQEPLKNLEQKIKEFMTTHTGILKQHYPPFSSKTITMLAIMTV